MKFGKEHYYKPTPKVMRKIGDSMLKAATAAVLVLPSLSFAFQNLYIPLDIVTMVIVSLLIIGKFLTNYFTDDGEEQKNESDKNNT